MSEIESDDFSLSSMNSWTRGYTSFSIVETASEVKRYTKNWERKGFVGGINLGGSPDVINYQRAIYTLLDLLGDCGGLLDSLKLIGYTIIVLT